MSIKTSELQQLQSILGTDSLLADTAAAGTGRLSLARAAEFFGAELVKLGNPVGAALSNKADLSLISNPNLLDNWYFVGGGSQQGGGQFPINQRRQTEYDGGPDTWDRIYCIDRWMTNSSLSVTKTGIEIKKNHTYDPIFGQLLNKERCFDGQVYTASVLFSDGVLLAASGVMNLSSPIWSQFANTTESNRSVYFGMDRDNTISFGIACILPDGVAIQAAKFELSSVQTLAHKDASGNWVLNAPPPNFQQELSKCQRYQLILSNSMNDIAGFFLGIQPNVARVLVSTPVSMRANPTVTTNNARLVTASPFKIYYFSGSPQYVYRTENNITIDLTVEGITQGEFGNFDFNIQEGTLILDANL